MTRISIAPELRPMFDPSRAVLISEREWDALRGKIQELLTDEQYEQLKALGTTIVHVDVVEEE